MLKLSPAMAEKRIKYETGGGDRISNLPEPIIHEILSRLSAIDVIRTCVLSKSLFSALTSSPVLDLDCSCFQPGKTAHEFLNYVHSSIQRRKNLTGNRLQKLRIRAVVENRQQSGWLSNAIGTAISTGVKVLDVDLIKRRFYLPRTVRSTRSITTLNLAGLRLRNLDNVDMGCYWPILENLSIRSCNGLINLKFSSTKIRSISLNSCIGLKSIKIQSLSLQNFNFTDIDVSECEIDVSEFEFLKVLSLTRVVVRDNWVKDSIPKLVNLQELKFDSIISNSGTITVSNGNLKKLEWIQSLQSKSDGIEIEAPNLESIIFNGRAVCDINIKKFTHLKSVSLTKQSGIPQDYLKELVANFKGVETLVLQLAFSSQLKCIEMNRQNSSNLCGNVDNMVQVKVITPNRFWFDSWKSIHLLRHYINLKGFLNVTVSTNPAGSVHKFYLLLVWNWIASLGHVKVLTLTCPSDEDLICQENSKVVELSPIYDLKHLTLKLFTPEINSVALVESFLWLSPNLETLSFASICPMAEERSIQFHYGSRLGTKDDPICCSRVSMKCWRHSITKVELRDFNDIDGKRLEDYFLENNRLLDIVKQ